MLKANFITILRLFSLKRIEVKPLLHAFFFGLLLPLSFAPFHIPGAAILSLALFYAQLCRLQTTQAFWIGLFYGLGYFGLGVSWVFISIHEYGHLNNLIAAFITLLFLIYLSLYPALVAFVFKKLFLPQRRFFSCLYFSALWVLAEYLRSTVLSGFPWLLVGFGQFDAPSKHLLPLIGVYGVSFLTCLVATLLVTSLYNPLGKPQAMKKRLLWLVAFISLLLSPSLLKNKLWSPQETAKPLSVGIIQANLSMRDKWDEDLFWRLVQGYKQQTEHLLGTELIVMPESAIPLPPNYVEDVLTDLHKKAKKAGSAVMLGIPKQSLLEEDRYFNALISLGNARGSYLKRHLVPFGEYIPKPFQKLSQWLNIPEANLKAGSTKQSLIKLGEYPIATLICYELAYGDLLRQQLPQAKWIISISDAGWFGHSLAMYQQQQMAQVRSLQTARYQVIANNDGLSSVVNTQGEITAALPAFSAGILKSTLLPNNTVTPWVNWGDRPILFACLFLVLLYLVRSLLLQSIRGVILPDLT